MNVKLVSITEEPEKLISYIARVSNPDNQNNPEYAKLIRYLVRNKHWSPFEHSFMTVEITTSMAIGEQLLRHRSFTFQKFSGRYSQLSAYEPIELRKQAVKNRQSSLDVFNPAILNVSYDNEVLADEIVEEAMRHAFWTYDQLIKAGVAKEVARLVLPAATRTTMYMTGSARSWIHYLDLRLDEHTQKEHRLIAQEIEKLFAENFPLTYQAILTQRKEEQDKAFLYKLLTEGKIQLP